MSPITRTSRAVLALVAVLLAASVALAPATAAADQAPTIQQFLKIRFPRSPEPLADGSMLQMDRPDGIWQLYRVTPKSAAAEPFRPDNVSVKKLTSFPDGLSAYTLSPDGRRVVLMHARGGNENTQLTLLDLQSGPDGATSPILDNPKAQASVNAWLRDGSGIIYSANDASPADFHLYRYDFATGKATKLLGREGYWIAADVTKDGRRVIVQRVISASNVEAYELDATTGQLRDVTVRPKDGTAACRVIGYAADEKSIFVQSDMKDGRQRLYLRDLKSGAIREPIPALAAYELDGAALNEERDMLGAVTNEDGYGVPHLYALPRFEPVALPPMEKGVFSASRFKGRTLVWALDNARTPGLFFETVFPERGKTGAAVTRQLTYADDQGVDMKGFRLPELVRYTSFDGRSIPAFLYLPAAYKPGQAIPFVVVYHGGPEDEHRPSFSAVMQYLVSRGYGLMLPNVRGSSGYGREYLMLDDYKNRWDSVRDGVEAAEWLVEKGYAKPGRIATYGGSYGGFMSVACVVEDQERVDRGERAARVFGAGVDIVGIVNMQGFLEKTSGYRRKLREAEYGPLTDPEFLKSVSSIHRADKINVPMFIAHGFNDPRVPVEEAMQLAVALKDRGTNPRVFIAPDEGHGFAKLDNRIYFYERCASFLDETIGPLAAGAPTP